jgi:single-strand DNA-binding protein
MLNKCSFIGRLGKDAEIIAVNNNKKVAKFSIATSETYKDKNGERQTVTEWINIVAWSPLAEIVEKYVKKGDLLYIEGKYTTRKYEKDGNTKYFTEIKCRELKMLGNKNKSTNKSEDNFEDLEDIDDLGF